MRANSDRKIAGLNFSGLGVKLPLRHLFNPGKWRSTIMIIQEDILERLQPEEDIHFACQTYRITGKPGEGRTQNAEIERHPDANQDDVLKR